MADREPARTKPANSASSLGSQPSSISSKANSLSQASLPVAGDLQPAELQSLDLDLTDLDDAAGFHVAPFEAVSLGSSDVESAAESDDPFAGLPGFAEGLSEQVIAASEQEGTSHDETAERDVADTLAPQLGTQPSPSNAVKMADEPAAPLALPRMKLRDRLLLRSVPSWLVSMMLHVAILMLLAAIQIEPVRDAIGVLMVASAGDEPLGLDENFDIRGPELDAPAPQLDQALFTPSPGSTQELALSDTSNLLTPADVTANVGKISNIVESVIPSSALSASGARISSSLVGRTSGSMKSEMLERFGGNAASEKSVGMALKWISEHQDRSGGWTFGHSRLCRGQCKDDGDLLQATNAATALALLPFLGAGQTHLEGSYKETVHNGLKFLINRMKVTGGVSPHGSWHEEGGSMYSHGLASIVVCEAYAMTRDPDLLQPAQLALNFIQYAQDPRGGGWRYAPKQPGDTSVVGWQLMAMKSGSMGNLVVSDESFRLASSFLDSMSVNKGAYYGYDHPTSKIEGRQSTTAVGLLCRMYLGWSKDNPGLKEGIKYLSERGPDVDDLYYSYYATQVLRQYGGDEWNKWNKAMRDGLLKAQVTDGHAAGSWFSAKGHNIKGGRLYCTALSAMILEVYYRHLPLYTDKSSDEEFEF